jgi:glycosyltransferase involved in cell wall biosynthesis
LQDKVKLLITTSTLPVSDSDEVPAFVKDQAIHLKKLDPRLEILIHAPHNAYSKTSQFAACNEWYREIRFHYFWPPRYELLTGRGIMPALKANKLLYAQIPFLLAFQTFSLWRLARKEKPDLLYAHWFTPQAISTALVSKLTAIPFVFTTHASDVSVLRGIPLAKMLVRLICKRAQAYSAVSQGTASRLMDFFGKDEWSDCFSRKLSVIPMGVEVDRRLPDDRALQRVREKHSLDHRPILLYLGRLAEKKGLIYLLEGLSLLPEPLRDSLQLVVAGDGQLNRSLQKKAKSLNLRNVTFTGYVLAEEKECLLTLADFLCLPSIIDSAGDSEGFPVVLMEGLAAGKIVLASNASGGEAVLQHERSGFIFEQKSPSALASALTHALRLTDEEAQVLQRNSRQLAKQFSWDIISRKYYRVLQNGAN